MPRASRAGARPTLAEVRAAYNESHGHSLLRDSDRFYAWIARRVLRRAPADARILDVGCGGGYLLREIARLSSRARLHGLELSDVALAEARLQAASAHLVLARAERLPYADRAFEAVVCLGNLEHFLDMDLAARELARVCRPGGSVWVLLPNGFYSGAIWKVITTGYGPDHHQIIDRFATVEEWRDLLQANHLRVESVVPYNRFKWWKRLLPRNLAWHFLYVARPE